MTNDNGDQPTIEQTPHPTIKIELLSEGLRVQIVHIPNLLMVLGMLFESQQFIHQQIHKESRIVRPF